MEEVAGYLKDNELDYSMLRGQTGPLVYPAGFMWIFSVLFYVTNEGEDILLAQYLFAVLHFLFIAVVLLVYRSIAKHIQMPPWSLFLLILSR